MKDLLPSRDRRRLEEWATRHGRTFPWRTCTDPYRLVVTELMLVRTRASSVEAIWEQFFASFPTRADLATADEQAVARTLRPLGLRWRTAVILRWARDEGRPEATFGVGEYVPAAVRIGVEGRGPLPVDVTIARLIARCIGVPVHAESRRAAVVRAAAEALGPVSRETFHAFLDVAALRCLPRSPACRDCPLVLGCATGRQVSGTI